MRSWYMDIMEQPKKKKLDVYELGQWVHDAISAAGGAFVILLLAFILTGARL